MKIKWAPIVFSASITLLDKNILYRTHLELLGFVNNYYILLINNSYYFSVYSLVYHLCYMEIKTVFEQTMTPVFVSVCTP